MATAAVVALGIAGSSPGGNARHWRLVDGLRRSVTAALAGMPQPSRWIRRPDGDGEIAVVPPDVGPAAVLTGFVPRLDRALREHNHGLPAHDRVRVLVALDHGEVTVRDALPYAGLPLLRAARLRELEPLRAAMDSTPAVTVGLVVSDDCYRRVVLGGSPGLDPRAYRRVTAEARRFYETAWIRLLDGPATGSRG